MRHVGLTIRALTLLAIAAAISDTAAADGVRWLKDPQAAMQQAAATGRPVLMKFTADWCGYCKKMERTTFSDARTAEVVHRDFVPLLIDADKHKGLTQQLKIKGLPATLIIAPDTTILDRITGFQTTDKLLPRLNAVTASHQPAPRVPALPAAQQKTTTVQAVPNPFETNPFAQQQPPAPPQQPAAPAPNSIDASSAARTATVATTATAAPAQPAFGGLCLTSVVEERQLIPGSETVTGEYRGRQLHFRDAVQRDLFFQNPQKYWPVLDGICAGTYMESGQSIPGKLQHAAVFRNQVWLFSDRDQMLSFIESPADYATGIEERQKQQNSANRSY